MTQLRGGFATTDPRLDRVPQYDPASRGFQVRQLLEERGPQRGKAHRPAHPTLDQGRDGACVGFSIATAMNASPRRIKPELGYDDAFAAYKDAQRIDPWPGEDYSGTSVLAGLKVAQQRGWISGYRWCGAGSGTAIDDVVDSLRTVGSVIFGIPWYRSMFDARRGGFLEVDPKSGLAGYHAIAGIAFRYAPIPGLDRVKREHVVMQNSWGSWSGAKWYGVPGHAYVLIESIEQHLLPRSVYGEAAVPVEV